MILHAYKERTDALDFNMLAIEFCAGWLIRVGQGFKVAGIRGTKGYSQQKLRLVSPIPFNGPGMQQDFD